MQITITVNSNASDAITAVLNARDKVLRQIQSRGTRAANALRNSELKILGGQRGGKVYRKSGTKGATYSASAPGEPPAVRTGNLRRNWSIAVQGGGLSIRPTIISGAHYATYLEHGTRKMAPRPFKDKIIQDAAPEVIKIYSEQYL